MIPCPFCTRFFADRKSIGTHFTKTHRDEFKDELSLERLKMDLSYGKPVIDALVKSYIDKEISVFNSPIDISNLLKLMGIKRTSKEERTTERYKKKYTSAIFEKYGVTNVSKSPEIQKKKEETNALKHGSYDEYLKIRRESMALGYSEYVKSDNHANTLFKIAQTCLERYGYENFGVGKSALSKRKESHAKTIATWDYAERLERTSKAREAVCKLNVSSIEIRVREALEFIGIQNVTYNKVLFNVNWDMVFDKTIIEVQGVFWHAKPTIYKPTDILLGKLTAQEIWDKDLRKKKLAESHGYSIIYIWEDDIRSAKDTESLIKLVKERIDEYQKT